MDLSLSTIETINSKELFWSIGMSYLSLHRSILLCCFFSACQSFPGKNSDAADQSATAANNDCDPQDNPSPDTGSQDPDTAVDDELPDCVGYDSELEEYAPIQMVGSGIPSAAQGQTWARPVDFVYYVDFSGTPGQLANHEGTDYVHNDQNVDYVFVRAAGEGRVVYVRTGCPQSSTFSANTALRECGSGWGNHVVVDHGFSIYTRYSHLAPNSIDVLVGDVLSEGEMIAIMGNSGRSQVRHLHFELGTKSASFDSCDNSQSMDAVYDPSGIASLLGN